MADGNGDSLSVNVKESLESGKLEYSADANKRAQEILNDFAKSIDAVATVIAISNSADRITKPYIDQAARQLRLKRESALTDLLLSLGWGAFSAAAGVGLTTVVQANPSEYMLWGSVIVALLGFGAVSAGMALKIKSGR